jgi:hypothetical protein
VNPPQQTGRPEIAWSAQNRVLDIVQAIAHSKSIVMDSHPDPEERAPHLCWLIHLVGDIHQPLHSTALFSRKLFPDGPGRQQDPDPAQKPSRSASSQYANVVRLKSDNVEVLPG